MTNLNEKIIILVPNFEGEWETYAGPFASKAAAVQYAEVVFGNRPRPAIMIVEEVGYLNPICE